MSNLKDMLNATTEIQQLLFFYELAKLGVIRFHRDNPDHARIIENFISMVVNYNEEYFREEPLCVQMERKNKFDIYRMIIVEVLAHSISDLEENKK